MAGLASAKNIARHLESALGRPTVTVHLVQSCNMPVVVQRYARSTVVELFAQIDISVRFAQTPPARIDEEIILVKLVRHADSSVETEVLGSALVSPAPRREVKIFCDRLAQYYDGDWLQSGRILGYAIAHELGHVLRADPSHSPVGVMKARWKRSDALPMLQGNVRFTTEDAERIHQVWEQRWRARLMKTGDN